MGKSNNTLNISEVGTIRDILMGQQMAEYDEKFVAQSEEMTAMNETINNRIELLEQKIDARLDTMTQEISKRFEQLEALLSQNVTELNSRISETSSTDKAKIGKMLTELGQKLVHE